MKDEIDNIIEELKAKAVFGETLDWRPLREAVERLQSQLEKVEKERDKLKNMIDIVGGLHLIEEGLKTQTDEKSK